MQSPTLLPMLFKGLFNKKVFIITFVALGLVAFDYTYAALDLTDKLGSVGASAGYAETEPKIAITIGSIIQSLLSLLGVIFMAYIIYGGYKWLTARGNEENLNIAKGTIRNGIVGLIIILGAYAISAFVITQVIEATGYTSPSATQQKQ